MTIDEFFVWEKKTGTENFLKRFGKLNFNNTSVLDYGCGHGALSIKLAELGAANVLGLDPSEKIVVFAKQNLNKNFSKWHPQVSFRHGKVSELPTNTFDWVVSKATFEHVIELESELKEIFRVLKPGGKLLAGFGPLYESPFGDHGVVSKRIPWAHVLLGRTKVVRAGRAASLSDLGLNGLKKSEYEKILSQSPFQVQSARYNVVRSKWVSRLLESAVSVPYLGQYLAINCYWTLQKPK